MKLPLPDSASPAGRLSRVVIAVAAGGGLALGVAGLAQADPADGPSGVPSAGASAAPGDPAAPAPGRPPVPASPGDPAAPGQRQHQPHLDGTVKSIGDGKVMIVDREGFTRQINIGTVPDTVKVGVRVMAVGKVNADGVSLDATSVTPAPDRPEGKGRPGGPGGPGRHGHPGPGGGPAPSGSAAPTPSGSGAPAPSGSAAPSATS